MKKQFCKKGHDTYIVGKHNRGCAECHRLNSRTRKRLYGSYSELAHCTSHWKIQGITLTIDQYNELLKLQNYCCAICKKPKSLFKRRLSVDHDHFTGKVRGLLCNNCNIGLGHFQDNLTLLDSATNYLLQFSKIGC